MITAALQILLALLGATTTEVGQWIIHSDRSDDEILPAVCELLPRAQTELQRKLGLGLRGQATVVLCGSTEAFRRATPGVDHRHTLGVAYPDRSVIYVNREAIEASHLEGLAVTLRHEMSHLIVGEVVRRGYHRVPLWFDEGVAVWTSGKVPLYDPQDFRLAVAAGTLRSLEDLADAFPLNPVARGVAYEQSESFVRFLVAHRGEAVVRRILVAAAAGASFEAAFQQAAGADVATLEREWLASIRSPWPWLTWWLGWVFDPYALSGLFAMAGVLLLIAFGVYLRRRRRKYEEWEQEESWPGDGDPPQDQAPRGCP